MKYNSNERLFLVQNVVCIMLIIGMTGYTFYAITQMPETIPIHWSNGVADGWGSKWISLLMPGIIVFVYVLSILFIKYLKKRNHSIMSTSWMKLGCVILFSIANVFFVQSALG